MEDSLVESLRYVPDTNGILRAISIDKYPGEMAIAKELIQNADDARSTWMSFDFHEDKLAVRNNGRPFSRPDEVRDSAKSDFHRISHVGLGKEDESMSGTYGIGFSSVFHMTDSPMIESNGWRFQIRVADTPVVESIPIEKETRFLLPYRTNETEFSRAIRGEVFDSGKAENFLESLPSTVAKSLLFLKALRLVEIRAEGRLLYRIVRRRRRRQTRIKGLHSEWLNVSLERMDTGDIIKNRWLIYHKRRIPVPEFLKPTGWRKSQQVSIGIILDNPQYVHSAYSLLPVRKTGFGFSWNSSRFATLSGRREFDLKTGLKREWNLWQARNLARLIVSALKDLASDERYGHYVYRILPCQKQLAEGLEETCYEKLREIVIEQKVAFCHSSSGRIATPSIIWTKGEHIKGILPRKRYREFLDTRFRSHSGVLVEEYGANKMSSQKILSFLSSPARQRFYRRRMRDPGTSRRLYEFLSRFSWTSEQKEALQNLEIVLNGDNALREAGYPIFLAARKHVAFVEKDDLVHEKACNSPLSIGFLRDVLGIQTISLEHVIVGCFLQRLKAHGFRRKTVNEFLWFLVGHLKEVLSNENIIRELRGHKHLLLKVRRGSVSNEVFFRDDLLRRAFGNSLTYLDNYFDERGRKERNRKWTTLFTKIGVKQRPSADIVVLKVREISSREYSRTTRQSSLHMFEFLRANWKNYSTQSEDLKALRRIPWIPTSQRRPQSPVDVCVGRHLSHLVGSGADFPSFQIPIDARVAKFLAFRREPRMKDVVRNLLAHPTISSTGKARRPDHRIYSFMNRRATSLSEDLISELQRNPSIWFRGKFWLPGEVFTTDCSNVFGPNGKLRAYIGGDRISRLRRLCRELGIRSKPELPRDYVLALRDIADSEGPWSPWMDDVFNRCIRVVADLRSILDEEQLDVLRNARLVRSHAGVGYLPRECLLLSSGMSDVPFVKEISRLVEDRVPVLDLRDPILIELYRELGANPLLEVIKPKPAMTSGKTRDKESEKKLRSLAPWIISIEFMSTGETESLAKTSKKLKALKAYRVDNLALKCSIELNGAIEEETPPIQSRVLMEKEGDTTIIYLSKEFDWQDSDDLQWMTVSLIPFLNPEVEPAIWEISLPQLLRDGYLVGITPLDRTGARIPAKILAEKKGGVEPSLPRSLARPEDIQSREFEVEEEPFDRDALDNALNRMEQGARSLDWSRLKRERKRIGKVSVKGRVRVKRDPQISAGKEFSSQIVGTEEVLVSEGSQVDLREVDVATFRQSLEKIVSILGGTPETVHVCYGPRIEDAFLFEGQLLFNLAIIKEVSPFYWVVVAARELAYHVGPRTSYHHTRVMSLILVRALESFGELDSALSSLSLLAES